MPKDTKAAATAKQRVASRQANQEAKQAKQGKAPGNNATAGRHPKPDPKPATQQAQSQGASGANDQAVHTPYRPFAVGQLVQVEGRPERFYRITWMPPSQHEARLSHGGGKVPVQLLRHCTPKQEADANELLTNQPLPEPIAPHPVSAARMAGKAQASADDRYNPPPGNATPSAGKKDSAHGGVKLEWRDPDAPQFSVIRIRNGTTRLYLVQRHSAYCYTLTRLTAGQVAVYSVYLGSQRQECGCPDFVHRRGGEHGCKHVRALLALKLSDKL